MHAVRSGVVAVLGLAFALILVAAGCGGHSPAGGAGGTAGTAGSGAGHGIGGMSAAAGGSNGGGSGSGGGAGHADAGAPAAGGATGGTDAGTPPPTCASGVVCSDVCAATSDIHRCGGCDKDCSALPHVAGGASLACQSGACAYTCAPGFGDCAQTQAGCPDVLSTPAQCGTCGASCPSNRSLCAPAAAGGFACVAACPTSAPTNCNGTCTDTNSDPANCNTCGRACVTFVPHAVPICQAALCDMACAPGYQLCAGVCVDVASDPANCGGCGASFVCAAPMRCRSAHCACPATCGGKCVDTETDGKNCGACGRDCLGGRCSGGVCQPVTLATGLAHPACIVVDGDTVYWSNQDGGSVMKVGVDGSGLMPVAEGQDEPFGIAVDATNVYWVNGGYNAAVVKAPRAGGPAVALTTGTPGRSQFRMITVDHGNIYFDDSLRTVNVMPVAGGTPQQLTMASPNGHCRFAIDGMRVYWAAYPGQDAVQAVPLTGGTAQLLSALASPIGDSWSIAINADHIFWTQFAAGNVLSLPIGGGPTVTFAHSMYAYGMTVDSSRIYWSASSSILSLPLSGGATPITHATGQGTAFDVAVDATAIYWVNWSSGTVMKVAK